MTLIRSSYAWVNLVKAMCGVGVFALPAAFQQSGLWVGIILTVVLGVANAHCMIKLVLCSHLLNDLKTDQEDYKSDISLSHTDVSDEEKSSTHNSEELQEIKPDSDEGEGSGRRLTFDYGTMAEEVLATRESCLRNLKVLAKLAVNLSLVGLQVGICSVFYIFVVDHVKEVFDYLFSTDLNRHKLFFTALPFFILLTSVRSIYFVSWIAFAGNIFVVGAIIIILVQLMFAPHIPLKDLTGITTIKDASVAAGSITYAFVSQAVVLPIENKMRRPRDMYGCCGVISTSVMFVGFLYVSTGILGYITYGDDIRGSITLNLTNAPIDLSVKVMLMLMTYCGYLIQHYPVVEMLWKSIEPCIKEAHPLMICAVDYLIRYAILMLSFSLAYLIPNIKQVIPFVGVTTGMLLSLIFPALLESIAFSDIWLKENVCKFVYNTTLNIIYIILGLFFLCLGTYSNYKALSS